MRWETGDRVSRIEVFVADLSQDQPYLGSLREGETVNEAGYFVRKGNRTVYPRRNRSLVIRVTTKDGVIGWGETYGLVAPQATAAIITDLLTGFVCGRDPGDVVCVHDELYDLMRVRGYTGGFYLDALAAVDIALWDIVGKIEDRSVAELLGGRKRNTIPAYVSGLPKDTLTERCELASSWQAREFNSFKFASPVADEGVVKEMRELRRALGGEALIACDLHWAFDAETAIQLADEMSEFRPWFLEAPVATEEIEQLRRVANESGQKIAVGEEWRTIFDARLRIERGACDYVQPEMGHTGITEFERIGKLAANHGLNIIPHATIGCGIFLGASLNVSSALDAIAAHEFQHSTFTPFQHFTDSLICDRGAFIPPSGNGLGVSPTPSMISSLSSL